MTNSNIETKLHNLLQHLYSLHAAKIDLSLDRVYAFLDKLGNPHLNLPPVIHAAGTNGKGSTLATLRAMLEAHDKRVHFYSSPHLVHPTERIYLAGSHITSEKMLQLLEECLEVNDGAPITFFEITTCAAFLAMAREPADYCLLETGMGGRLDATNVVPDPVCTIITSIGYDHMEFLGSTLQQIAREKAGIMKPGVPCIIGAQSDEAITSGVIEVFQARSTDLSPPAPLALYGADYNVRRAQEQVILSLHGQEYLLPTPNLAGDHQYRNTGAALAALASFAPELLRPDILSQALGQIRWPGRLDKLTAHPYCTLLPQDWELWLDGGHNADAAQILAAQAKKWENQDDRPLHLVIAMTARKDPRTFLDPLLPYADSVSFTTIDTEEQMHAPQTLAAAAKDLGYNKFYIIKNLKGAVEGLGQRANTSDTSGRPARVLICGSLYLAGDVLSFTTDEHG